MCKISVIVPIYNVEKYLNRCVDSILVQTFTDFELILVDDGSPDNCGKICDEYAAKDSRIHVIHKKNGGLSDARNAGIDWAFASSDCEWISFVDSDDWIHPQYLEILYRAATEHQVDVSICAFQKTNGDIESFEVNEDVFTVNTEEFYDRNRINAIIACGKLYRKQCFAEIRYPVGKLHEDEFTTYKILFKLTVVAFTEAKLYYYYKNEESIMHATWSDKRLDALDAFKEQISYFKTNGYDRAFVRSVRAYIGTICDDYKLILNTKNNKLLIKLKQELRKALKTYNEQVPFDECRWAYMVAYPKFTKFYGLAERVVKGLWRKINGRN